MDQASIPFILSAGPEIAQPYANRFRHLPIIRHSVHHFDPRLPSLKHENFFEALIFQQVGEGLP